MPWSGGVYTPANATFTGTNLFAQAEAADRDIRADDVDSFIVDLKAVIENTVTRDGQNSPSSNLPMNSKRHTGVQDAVDRTDYASYGQLLDRAGAYVAAASVGGTGNAITLTPTPAITAYAVGQVFRFIVKTANDGNVTVNVSGLGVKSVRKNGTAQLASGDLVVGRIVTIEYDGTNFQATGLSQTLGTAAQVNTGIAQGNVALLQAGGTFATARIPNLNASKINAGEFAQARIPDLPFTKITGTAALSQLPAAAQGRTTLRSTTSDDWTNANAAVALTVADIDNYAYLTLSIAAATGAAAGRAWATATITRSEIPEDATPEANASAPVITFSSLAGQRTFQFYVGRNTDGTTLYVEPVGGNLWGRVAAVWGGAF